EVLAHRLERLDEALARGLVDLADRRAHALLGLLEVGHLRREERAPVGEAVALVEGLEVDRAELLHLPPQRADLAVGRALVEGLALRLGGRLQRRQLDLQVLAHALGQLVEAHLRFALLARRRRDARVRLLARLQRLRLVLPARLELLRARRARLLLALELE